MSDPALGGEAIALDEGRLLVSPNYLTLLRHNNLETFDSIMGLAGGKLVRSVPGRKPVRLELQSASGPVVTYLKRYDRAGGSARRFLLRWMGWADSHDEALHEWRMIHTLRAHGFLTAAPIAAGQARSGVATARSFVMTAQIQGGVPGDAYVKSLSPQQRRQFMEPLAELTRSFHGAGFIHKDYYLGHVFVVDRPEKPELFLIDLQRVLGPARFRERWLVKDVGGLAYSARKAGVSRTDLMRLYKKCFRKNRLEERDKRLIRKILRRVNWLFGRTPKYGESPLD